MFLKKASIVSVLALAVGVSSVSAVSAATATKAANVQVMQSSYIVNGKAINLRSIQVNGVKQVSLRDLSVKLGADLTVVSKGSYTVELNNHLVELKSGSKAIKVDGNSEELSTPVTFAQSSAYVNPQELAEALGANYAEDASGAIWIDANLLGNVSHVQWADANRIIASQETEDGRIDYLVNVQTGQYFKLLNVAEGSDLVVSPSGTLAAFTDVSGQVFLIDLNTRLSWKVSKDDSIKPELVWAADSKSIYFLQGDKGTVIAKLDLATAEIKTILSDKVDYKSNLKVSTDGKVFTYAITKPGAVVADSNAPVDNDDVTIDMKGTEPQLFVYTVDPSIKDNKAVQLTTGTDDKVFIEASADGNNVYYVSVSETADNATLVAVNKDKTTKTLFADADIYEATFSHGKWTLLTAGANNGQSIIQVDATTGAKTQLYTVDESVSEIIVKDGAPVIIVKDGQVFVNTNGLWKPITR
ncbi:MAG: stalk domain-containing protein [Candidatus Cohnella colombiensis]|uniref:Stalk domain-containing protein n=1 Tax=Candidatus Cohnella colombiensis TaxID=3121368 RepID=A0AA95F1X8_9BACL|nr:MAG: stalk domain-containing protein [Cohnella sp.]